MLNMQRIERLLPAIRNAFGCIVRYFISKYVDQEQNHVQEFKIPWHLAMFTGLAICSSGFPSICRTGHPLAALYGPSRQWIVLVNAVAFLSTCLLLAKEMIGGDDDF